MTRVVVSQTMFFPWVGLFEQVRLADVFVHYDDVQFARGFMNRVQVKVADGWRWLTAPTTGQHRDQHLKNIALAPGSDWKQSHRTVLEQAYKGAPFRDEMLELLDSVYALDIKTLGDLGIASIEQCCAYFAIGPSVRFARSSELGISGASWQRLLDITRHLGGEVYLTGHGARHYLDHEAFEAAEILVEYMDYEKIPYPQLHGDFNPFVSILDLVANVGRAGREVIRSHAVDWRKFSVSV